MRVKHKVRFKKATKRFHEPTKSSSDSKNDAFGIGQMKLMKVGYDNGSELEFCKINGSSLQKNPKQS